MHDAHSALVGQELTRRRRRMLAAAALGAATAAILASPAGADTEAVYRTPDGVPVRVQLSASYPADPARAQAVVNLLASHLHGPELATLRVFIGTPQDLVVLCGGELTLGCYDDRARRMYVPGEAVPGQPPADYIITHEYGHHLEAVLRNPPWSALLYGAKRWASTMRVCPLVADGYLADAYERAPGEAFAATYAEVAYPRLVEWGYSRLLAPTPAALRAVRADVVSPWRRPVRRTVRLRVSPGHPRSITVATPLDGTARITARVPAGPAPSLDVSGNRRLVARGRRSGSAAIAKFTVCGQRALTAHVAARAGAQRVDLRIKRP